MKIEPGFQLGFGWRRGKLWEPKQLSQLVSDFDPAFAIVSGGKVTSVPDQNGTAAVVQATDNLQPTLVTGVANGRPVLRFAGGQSLHSAFASKAQPNTIALVVKLTSQAGTPFIVDGPASHRNLIYCASGTVVTLNGGAAQFSTTQNLTAAFVTILATFNGASSVLRVNGAQVGTGDASNQDLTGVVIGSDGAQTTFMSGDIARVQLYHGTLSAGDIANIEAWFRRKWATW